MLNTLSFVATECAQILLKTPNIEINAQVCTSDVISLLVRMDIQSCVLLEQTW